MSKQNFEVIKSYFRDGVKKSLNTLVIFMERFTTKGTETRSKTCLLKSAEISHMPHCRFDFFHIMEMTVSPNKNIILSEYIKIIVLVFF